MGQDVRQQPQQNDATAAAGGTSAPCFVSTLTTAAASASHRRATAQPAHAVTTVCTAAAMPPPPSVLHHHTAPHPIQQPTHWCGSQPGLQLRCVLCVPATSCKQPASMAEGADLAADVEPGSALWNVWRTAGDSAATACWRALLPPAAAAGARALRGWVWKCRMQAICAIVQVRAW